MKENELSSRYLSKSELTILLVTLVAVGIGTTVTSASSWLFAGLFHVAAPILFFSLPGYFLVTYSNRNREKFKRTWFRNTVSIMGAALIAVGLIGAFFSIFSPWIAWVLIGVAVFYFYNR